VTLNQSASPSLGTVFRVMERSPQYAFTSFHVTKRRAKRESVDRSVSWNSDRLSGYSSDGSSGVSMAKRVPKDVLDRQ